MRIGHEQPLHRTRHAIPKPEKDHLLVKIQAAGVCHSDCFIRDMKEPTLDWPAEFVLGHEGAGEVVELGPGIDQSQFKVGDRVAMHIIPGCNNCTTCRLGHRRLCKVKGNGGYGLGRDGMFAEYVSVQAYGCVKVPDNVSIEAAAIASDAVLTAYHAVKHTADVKPDQTIAIFGLGGLGLNGLQIAQYLGVKRILVADKKQEAVDLAVKLGVAPEDAFCTSNSEAKPIHEVVAEKGILVDTVLDFVGHEQTILSAQLTVREVGLIVLVGLISQQGPLLPLVMTMRSITFKGSYNGEVNALKECLDLLSRGVIKPEIEKTSIENLQQVMDDLDAGKYQGRMVLTPDWKELS
ncbi:hypothetical protein M409DRAFT_37868 [Zasmidium cellare ATCC 36951]|uniref:Enoyl reductase (ER) domain-containing protein n=1 Tax=Zasmidium cellare ATCC 36951 TaxID=1080233 RepID=A0A6A6BYE1_ZASCE|nr:uncharacterized protein M409DRAFT_37868 [Zasmidium cellare ATCC 36951]KAF2159801.1 hypothetical protein M409DRAFT_37868 [Zasmidium cellare ATCC 36951]